MDRIVKERIEQILKVKVAWLQKDNDDLNNAIKKTIELGFHHTDVSHALKWIYRNINRESLTHWVDEICSKHDVDWSDKNQAALVIHAGNLPLVGFQDFLAVYLSGYNYNGKLSRRDPFLMHSFLTCIEKILGTDRLTYSTNRLTLPRGNDLLLFAGSEVTLETLIPLLIKDNLIHSNTSHLVRTAHFSIVFTDLPPSDAFNSLAEGILRYDGKGCRSIKIIVSPNDIHHNRCSLTDFFEAWWTQYPTHRKTSNNIRQRAAFNHSVGIKQIEIEHILIEQSRIFDFPDDLVYWINGDLNDLQMIYNEYKTQIQTIYHLTNPFEIEDGMKSELAESAQMPLVNWKPDRVDTLEWIVTQNKS